MLRIKPYLTTKLLDHGLAEGKAEAGSSRVILRVRARVVVKFVRSSCDTAKHVKYGLFDIFIHPDTVVRDTERDLVFF